VGICLLENRVFKWVNAEMVRLFGYETKENFHNKSVRMIYTTVEVHDYAGQTIYDSLIIQATPRLWIYGGLIAILSNWQERLWDQR